MEVQTVNLKGMTMVGMIQRAYLPRMRKMRVIRWEDWMERTILKVHLRKEYC
jgi:hypothetical protein